MFIEAISNSDLEKFDKIRFHKLANIFEDNLPNSLFLNHYELSEEYGQQPSDWSDFLRIRTIDRLVQKEIAQVAEIGARRALNKLQSGYASTQDIQAAKELLNTSKLLKSKSKQREKVVITRIPAKEFHSNGHSPHEVS